MQTQKTLFTVIIYGFLISLAVVMVIPLVWMAFGTVKTEAELLGFPPTFFPRDITTENYTFLFQNIPGFPRYLINSTIVTLSCVVGNIFFCSLAGFAFAKLRFPGREVIFLLFMVALLIPFQVIIVQVFRVVRDMGLLDTYWALILPGIVSPFGIFLMRQYIRGLPTELLEASRAEGASDFQAYWYIFLPLCRPALAALAVFVFLGTWNDFLWPLVATSSNDMRVITVGIATLQGQNTVNWAQQITGAFISSLPILIFYVFMQRQFIAGMTAGAVKG